MNNPGFNFKNTYFGFRFSEIIFRRNLVLLPLVNVIHLLPTYIVYSYYNHRRSLKLIFGIANFIRHHIYCKDDSPVHFLSIELIWKINVITNTFKIYINTNKIFWYWYWIYLIVHHTFFVLDSEWSDECVGFTTMCFFLRLHTLFQVEEFGP